MPAPSVSILQRAVRFFDRSVHYEVTATVTAAGTLPFKELFVRKIEDPLNPKSDTLARVAVPYDVRTEADAIYVRVDSSTIILVGSDKFARIANIDELTTMPRDRVVAVRRGETEYLASTISIIYDKLTTAEAAGRQIVDRLSKLTTDYVTHYGRFLTDPAAVYALPVTSRSVEAVLTAAFVAARAERVAAEAVRDAAQEARVACGAGDALLRDQIDKLVADVAFLEAARLVVSGMTETASLVGGTCTVAPSTLATTNVKTFVLNAADARSYEALLISKRGDLQTARTTLASREPECADLARQLADAEAGVARTRAIEEAALRDVYASCPTFNPSSV